MYSSKHSTKQKIIKLFLFVYLISSFFSIVNIALNYGIHIPNESVLKQDIGSYIQNFISINGGITFLTISIISILATLSKQMIKMDGITNKIFMFIGTFLLFSISIFAIANISPTEYQIYLYACYHAGIIFGAFFAMLKNISNSDNTDSFEW